MVAMILTTLGVLMCFTAAVLQFSEVDALGLTVIGLLFSCAGLLRNS